MRTVPDNDVTAAVVSRDAVATNTANAVGRRGPCNLRAAVDDMGGFMIICLISYDRRTTIVYGMDCMVSCAFEQKSADICRYLQISADICRYLCKYLVTPADICSHVKTSDIGINISCS